MEIKDIPWKDKISEDDELIVREAIVPLQKHVLGNHSREDQEVLRCLSDLKRHFGIEE